MNRTALLLLTLTAACGEDARFALEFDPPPGTMPAACLDGEAAPCNCADGRPGMQTCAEGTFDACTCDAIPPPPPPLSCFERSCAGLAAACGPACEDVGACLEACTTARCRADCLDDGEAAEGAAALWQCQRTCDEIPPTVPVGYPQLGLRDRCAAVYVVEAPELGIEFHARNEPCRYAFGITEPTAFGTGHEVSFGVLEAHELLTLQVADLEPGRYAAEPGGTGSAAMEIRLEGQRFARSADATRALPVVHIDGGADGVVWGRFVGAACSRDGCFWAEGAFSAHTRR